MNQREPIYRVIFSQNNQVYEIYARYISEETMVGFIEVEQLIFSQQSSTLVDPSEEKLRAEFKDVERLYLPMHTILRIDEVFKEGPSRIQEGQTTKQGNVWHFPFKKKPSESDYE